MKQLFPIHNMYLPQQEKKMKSNQGGRWFKSDSQFFFPKKHEKLEKY